MKSSRCLVLAVWLAVGLCACRAASGRIADHLYWGVVTQNRVYANPTDINPGYVFLIELETDMNVDHVEFLTAGGRAYLIPNDPYTVSGDVETYHEIWDGFDVWGYWGYFSDVGALKDYGDGLYTITLHYTDRSVEQTDVWYGVPDTEYAMAQPVQKPYLTAPPYEAAVPSPVTFTWDACTDPNVYDIYLAVTDANDQAVVDEILDAGVTGSDAYTLDEGWYDAELIFENYWSIYNADGIPFDLIKANVSMYSFEVMYNSVYRFWSPVTGRHFYTARVREKNKLINRYPHAWTYEGIAFHACATSYYAGLSPVYRFWSDRIGSHFYTLSESEKYKLIDKFSHVWTYEGIVFYAYPNGWEPPEARAVYRFYKSADGTHFYTMSESEMSKLINDFSHVYTYEGIAYYSYE